MENKKICPECQGPMDKVARIYKPLDESLVIDENTAYPYEIIARPACIDCADKAHKQNFPDAQ